MSYQLTATNGRSTYDQDEYVVDTIEDLAKIPTSRSMMGSTAFVIDGSRVFMLNSEKKWKEI